MIYTTIDDLVSFCLVDRIMNFVSERVVLDAQKLEELIIT